MPIVLLIAKFFGISPLRIMIYGALIIGGIAFVTGEWLYLRSSYITMGRTQAFAQIAARNREALDNVRNAEAKVDQCRSSGGTWNTVDGVCDGQ